MYCIGQPRECRIIERTGPHVGATATERRGRCCRTGRDAAINRLFHEHTSGTSGTPIDLWWSRLTVRAWYALFEARWRRWHGVTRHDRWAIFGGQLITPAGQGKPPFWVWNAALNQLYVSSYHLRPQWLPHFVKALQRYRVRYLFGYTSSLHALAQGVGTGPHDNLGLIVAITNAESALDHQRDTIAGAFRCPVRETYGMAEIVAAAGECAASQLHLWPEVGWLEIRDGAQEAARGTAGELICTGLLNEDMPLIRYRGGDRGALPADSVPCGCGRTLPTLARIEGRTDDVLYTRDGRPVGRLDPVFKRHLAIREAQVIQEALDTVRVRCVPAEGYSDADTRSIIAGLRARMGSVEVIVEPVEALPRTANGKFRSVICNLDADELRRIRVH